MATYKDIHGSSIQNVDGNPGNPKAGQFWYDSISSEFKYQDQFVGSSWSSNAPINTGRSLPGGCGTTSAAIMFGGETPAPALSADTESWNGSSWTEVNNLNTARQISAGDAGTSTSGLGFGGYNGTAAVNSTELWNGTNWTEVNNLNTARSDLTGAGNTSSAIVSGGDPASAVAEQWSGTTPSTVTFTDS